MSTLVKCGTLFTGADLATIKNASVLIEDGLIKEVGPTEDMAKRHRSPAEVLDYSNYFVMPGLCDYHTHLAYGNAKTEEDIDLYASVEFRALRGVFMARRMLNAGVTSMCDPGSPSRVCVAIRDAINAGMFDGPRITTAAAYLTGHQSLTDWYPTWIGQPQTSIGHVVRNPAEAIEEIRSQVKDGVDVVKIGLDGTYMHSLDAKGSGLVAAFDQEETTRMVREIQRLGRRAIVHARGREAVLYAARAGADVIFHASWIDDEGIEAALKNGCAVCPSLTLLVNTYEYSQPTDAASRGFVNWCKYECDIAFKNLEKAHKAGVPILNGSETGFAMTPYGEWHARELEIMVRYLGLSAAEALRSATMLTGAYMRDGGKTGTLSTGRNADLLVVDGNPLSDITQLLEARRIHRVILGGRNMPVEERRAEPARISDFSQQYWSDLYTRDRVAELFPKAPAAAVRAG